MINALHGIANYQVPSEIPTVPEIVSFVADDHEKLTLTWSASSDDVAVAGYQVRIKKTTDGSFGSWVDVSNVLTHQFTGLDADTEYQAQVRAYDAVPNYSAASSTATATTDAAPLFFDVIGVAPLAAFGLRKLNNSFSGACLRVRRASDNTEQDIGFDGESLDWAAATTFATGSDLYVTTWYDQSASAKNVVQATTSRQPKLDTSAKEIVFDGSSDQLVADSNLGLSGDFETTVFLVSRLSIGTAFKFGTAATLQMAGFYYTTSASVRIVHAGSNDYGVAAETSSVPNRNLWTYRKTSGAIDTTSEIYQNGAVRTVSGTASTATPNMTDGPLIVGSIGDSAYLGGAVEELVIVASALSSTPRGDGETDIMDYYGL